MKNKKIIFFLLTLNIGGGERVASELSLNLPDNIEKIIVLFKNEISYPYKGKLICLNLPISNNFLLKIYSFFFGLFRLKKIIRKEKPDYVISFGAQSNIINILAHKRSLVRVEHFIPTINRFWEKIYGILIKFLFNKSNKIIVVSKKIANNLIENFGVRKEKIKLIYNLIDIEKTQSLANQSLESKYQEIFNNPVIINIGRITEIKGQQHLIKAFKNVKNRIKEAKLVILGKGELELRLRQLIKDLNLQNDVYLLGWQENPFKFLAKSKLFVLSSLWEALPCSILEAMACGLPVVSVDCKSGPREILAPGTNINQEAKDIEYVDYGILCPPFNEQKLSQAMIEILTNKELSDNLVKKSKQRVKDFDINQIIRQWDFLSKEK